MANRTITLSQQDPVVINDDTWPLIAEGRWDTRNGTPLSKYKYEYDSHAIRVRKHADGRAIVYGILRGAAAWTGTEGRKAGELLEAQS